MSDLPVHTENRIGRLAVILWQGISSDLLCKQKSGCRSRSAHNVESNTQSVFFCIMEGPTYTWNPLFSRVCIFEIRSGPMSSLETRSLYTWASNSSRRTFSANSAAGTKDPSVGKVPSWLIRNCYTQDAGRFYKFRQVERQRKDLRRYRQKGECSTFKEARIDP
jgi:hypothetical protein